MECYIHWYTYVILVYTGIFAGYRAGPWGHTAFQWPWGGGCQSMPWGWWVFLCTWCREPGRGYEQVYGNLPDKTGEKGKWIFEKAHSINRPLQTAVSMSPVNRESAILHLLPCWTVEKWCGDQRWLCTMFILLYTIYILWYWCYVFRQTQRILLVV